MQVIVLPSPLYRHKTPDFQKKPHLYTRKFISSLHFAFKTESPYGQSYL
jgi:hypothetical protein